MMEYLAHFMFFLAVICFLEACVRMFVLYFKGAGKNKRQGASMMPAGAFLVAAFMSMAIGNNMLSAQSAVATRLVPKDENNRERQVSSLAFSATGRTELKEIHPVKYEGKGKSQRYWLQHYYNGSVIEMGGNFYVPDSGKKLKLRPNDQFISKIAGTELGAPTRVHDMVYTFYKREDEHGRAQKCLLFEKVLSTRMKQQDYNGYLVGDFCYAFEKKELDPIAMALMKSARIRHMLPKG